MTAGPAGSRPPPERTLGERLLSPIADVRRGEAASALLMALTMFPLAFPQLARMVTGARVSDAAFQQRQTRFLRHLGSHLAFRMPAHAVGQHEEARFPRVAVAHAVFVLFPAALATDLIDGKSHGHAFALVRFSSWELTEVCLGGVWRYRVGSPRWSPLRPDEVEFLLRDRTGEQRPPSTVEQPG